MAHAKREIRRSVPTAERIPTLLEVTDGQSHAVLIFWNAVSSPPRGSGELKPERGGR